MTNHRQQHRKLLTSHNFAFEKLDAFSEHLLQKFVQQLDSQRKTSQIVLKQHQN